MRRSSFQSRHSSSREKEEKERKKIAEILQSKTFPKLSKRKKFRSIKQPSVLFALNEVTIFIDLRCNGNNPLA